MGEQSSEGWCLLLVKPGKEAAARNSFRRYGIQAYWPNYHTQVRWSPNIPNRRENYKSVIPGYLFVNGLADAKFWKVVELIEDIINVALTYSGDLVRLRDSDIETIRAIEKGLNTPLPGKSLHAYKTGDKVRFKESTWAPGVVINSTGDGRLTVEVEMMGRLVPVQIYPHQIEKA